MKEHLINDKILFCLLFLFTFTCFLSTYNSLFGINGGEFELFFSDVILLTILISFILLIFYFLLSRFIKNKRIIFIDTVFFIFAIIIPTNSIIIFIILIVLSFILRKDNLKVNIASEVVSTVIAISIIILAFINIIITINNSISFNSRLTNYKGNKRLNIEKGKPSPNIYWFHMDGMTNTEFINKYYNEPLEEFNDFLNNNGFINNKDASFIGGQHTLTALPSLISPDYYDNYLRDHLNEYNKCELEKCKTKTVPTFKDLNYQRIDSELLKGLKKKGYTTISITEYNQYTALKTYYVYDIYEDKGKCQVPFFKGKTNTDDIYSNILKIHFNSILSHHGLNIFNNYHADKYIKCIRNDYYPNINKNNVLKETLTSLIDSKDKNNNPKFYFIDNNLMHIYWNYDKEGNVIRNNNTDLKDFDDCYIYTTKVLMEFINNIRENDQNSIIIIQGDHGIHVLDKDIMKEEFNINDEEVLNIRNSTISLISIPDKYKTDDIHHLNNPLNISRYLINSYVGDNYEYIKEDY